MACCTMLNGSRGSEASRVCGSVCLYTAFHLPHISPPFISPPPLCRFRGGVQSASRISFQLVLVQILILKGGLNQPRLRKDERKEHQGGREGKGPLWGRLSSSVVYLAINVLDCPVKRESQVCRGWSNGPPLIQIQDLVGFITLW